MKYLPKVLLVAGLLLSLSVSQALALTLDKIGTTTVTSNSITSWYYQGSNPIFSGTTDPSTAVSVSINSVASSATADASGNWSYTPTTLSSTGTYPVVITSGTETISFNLDLTTTSSTASSLTTTKGGTMSGSVELPESLPQSGGIDQTVALISFGLLLVTGGMLFYWKVVPGLLFAEDQNDTQE